MHQLRQFYVPIILIGTLLTSKAEATWSIVLVNAKTKEIAVGSATCLTNFDLNQNLPVVLVDVGAACAQSAVDSGAFNRVRIRDQFLEGTSPEDILEILSNFDNSHESRQYGIVDTRERAATFTGNQAGAYAGGVTGNVGDIYYAIQGNVITGPPVVFGAEDAVINTPGDMPAKLMAAMEAARFYGGDGRCSCTVLAPTACGAPPPNFEKSAHIAFMVGTRTGDTDGVCNSGLGCANGDYFMDFNVPGQSSSDPDPVFQLQDMYDQWREDLVGAPDGAQSTAVIDKAWIRANSSDTAKILVTVRDWQQNPVTTFSIATAGHHSSSAGATGVVGVTALGDGVHEIEVGFAINYGLDRFQIRVDSLTRPITVIPFPELLVVAMSDLDADGDTDLEDFTAWTPCFLGPGNAITEECADANFNFDSTIDLRDAAFAQNTFSGELCIQLDVLSVPERLDLCEGESATLSVEVEASPPPVFQWFKDGEPMDGETASTLELPAATPADEGYYHVEIGNSCGIHATEPVAVRVFDGPCP